MIPDSFLEKMPFLVRPENVVRYENNRVYVLDRRKYPQNIEFLELKDCEEVAKAITDMVTQSLGPRYLALYGMALAAKAAKVENVKEELERAGERLINTRPTNHEIREAVTSLLKYYQDYDNKKDTSAFDIVLSFIDHLIMKRHYESLALAEVGSVVLKDGDTILTHCFPETTLVYLLIKAKDEGKKLKAFSTETRPYLQGAKLTASVLHDMDIPVTLISDSMVAEVFSKDLVNVFLTGTDRVTMSGHVVNKVGTLQNAILSKTYGVPYYALSYGPDRNAKTPQDVKIEYRDPVELLSFKGIPIAKEGVKGYYPAFDITPPLYITGIITDKGIFEPLKISEYPDSA
ncbi:MAG: S-methyl-5-thioribose-1-phosphate isomerase [Anaerovoracaceae bacterium]|nr:S-methyl-5-thioribose-1-phosphate isomerase [Clostridiales bacterium]